MGRIRAAALIVAAASGAGLTVAGAQEPAAGPAAAGEPAALPLFNVPRLWIGGGTLSYREHDFKTAPTLESKWREPVVDGGAGWDFILEGRHSISLDLEFFGTDYGREEWREAGEVVQENQLRVWRFDLSLGYLWSTWNRGIDPRHLEGASRMFRFGAGGGVFYRHQNFDRTDFLDFTENPPVFTSFDIRETFDMGGGEAILDFEVGPRHIIAGFLRGRGGIEYVAVRNNGFGSLGISFNDTTIDTYGVHGRIEAGVVSRPLDHLELRLGYRYMRQEVFEAKKSFASAVSPTVLVLELPDNTTEMHLVFVEAAIPF